MLDDLSAEVVGRLASQGLEPCLVIETSPENLQAWIRVVDRGPVPYSLMGMLTRRLAEDHGADPRAVSPRQPGRLPGFTNRKAKHQQPDGRFPFVRLVHADSGRVASKGADLVEKLAVGATVGAAAGAPPETPLMAADPLPELTPDHMEQLNAIHENAIHENAIHAAQRARIDEEVQRGRRPLHAASQSEIDFAVAVEALRRRIGPEHVVSWLAASRPEKHTTYAWRTVEAAAVKKDWLSASGASQAAPTGVDSPRI